jgi:ATP-dependent RNA helicase RhlE
VHRVGRTARAEKKGIAVTLVNAPDLGKMLRIEKLIGYKVTKVTLPDSVAALHADDKETRVSRPGYAGDRSKRRNNQRYRNR